MVKVQAAVPEQAPLHPEKIEAGDAGDAVKVTVLPVLMGPEFVQVPVAVPDVIVQLIPAVPVTVPLPAPDPVTVTVLRVKFAVTAWAAVIGTVQVPVPVQAPLQPEKDDPEVAVGVSVTDVPLSYGATQVPGQLMPAGLLVTVPEPEPAFVTVKLNCAVKIASTAIGEVPTVKLHAPLPEHWPPQFLNTEPAAADWDKVTTVPLAKVKLQVPGQLIPAGELVTVPLPLPGRLTVTSACAAKVAPTESGEVPMITMHVVVAWPAQAPLQLTNVEPT